MSRSMEKLSSGYRINKASDDPAGLVISEQFRAQIAGLNRAISNSEGSINMIQTAEGALNEINSLLVSMRELAIHAANEGFNDAAQLAADQAEIDNAIQTIDRIAANTQFGTKKLLDGTKDNVATITSSNSAGITIAQSGLKTGTHSISATKTADSTATLNTTSLGISLNGTGTPYNVSDGIHNIDVIQASAGAEKYSEQISVKDAWENGITFAAAGSEASVGSSAAITTIARATAAGDYKITLNYQENGEAVTGSQVLTASLASGDTASAQAAKWQAAIDANSFLQGKVNATLNAAGDLVFQAANKGAQYSVRFASLDTSGIGSANFSMGAAREVRGVSSNQLQFKIKTAAKDGVTATMSIGAATYNDIDTLAAAIQTGLQASSAFGTIDANVGNIDVSSYGTNQLKFYTNDHGSDYYIQFLSLGSSTENAEQVLEMTADSIAKTGTDALVSFDNYTNSLTAVNYNSTQNVTLYNKSSAYTAAQGRGSVDVTIGTTKTGGVDLGNLLLDVSATQFDVRLDAGPATSVTAGEDAIVWNASRDEWVKVNYSLISTGGTETVSNVDQSLVFQIGGSVGQTATVAIRNMAASALGKNLVNNMFTSLAGIDVQTAQGAQDAQAVIDAAIDEVSTTRGSLGSFQKNSLESNLTNLRIAAQNLTASESSIRDTDMAREMSTFVRHQILMQAGTSMLAQGNQVPQVVLSLFQ